MEGFILQAGQVIVVPEVNLVVNCAKKQGEGMLPLVILLRKCGRGMYRFYDSEERGGRRGSSGFVLFVQRQPRHGERILIIWVDVKCASAVVLPEKSLLDDYTYSYRHGIF